MPPPFRVGILTVSDTSFADASTDLTGPALAELFNDASNFVQPVERAIAPDDISAIQAVLTKWSSSGVSLAITTGGTGFSVRDVTPEAVRPLLAKEATGLQHLLLATSLSVTPMAAMARPVCGVTHEGMIIATVPGSPKGALENTRALIRLMPHVMDLASGGSGQAVHKSMGMPTRTPAHNAAGVGRPQDGGTSVEPVAASRASHTHSHDHSHSHDYGGHHAPIPRTIHSSDLSQGASARQRISPYPIISLTEAYSLIFSHTRILPTKRMLVTDELRGYILAEDITASHQLPMTSTTNVDGYAVDSKTIGEGVYPVLTAATYPLQRPKASVLNTPLPEGHIYRINTGAPLPMGTDAVIMVEDTGLVESDETTNDEKQVRLLAVVPSGENVRQPGSDVKAGERVLEKGTRVSEIGGEIGTLAFVGRKEVSVYRRPVVAMMSTGNELTGLHAPGVDDKSGHPVVYDSNRPSLDLILRSHGYEVVDLGIVPDTISATSEALRLGASKADVIIATGGTSMGEADLLKPVIERELGGDIVFGRVAMKPGKPTTFGTFSIDAAKSHAQAGKTLVFALPGNPASALVTFHLFVLPCLRKMSGYPGLDNQGRGWHLPRVRVRVTSDMRLDPRPEFHRVWIEPESSSEAGRHAGSAGCGLIARSTGGQRSSRTVSLAGANGLICLPSSAEPDAKPVKAGDIVEAVLMGQIGC